MQLETARASVSRSRADSGLADWRHGSSRLTHIFNAFSKATVIGVRMDRLAAGEPVAVLSDGPPDAR